MTLAQYRKVLIVVAIAQVVLLIGFALVGR